jgi:hypothetical protein
VEGVVTGGGGAGWAGMLYWRGLEESLESFLKILLFFTKLSVKKCYY